MKYSETSFLLDVRMTWFFCTVKIRRKHYVVGRRVEGHAVAVAGSNAVARSLVRYVMVPLLMLHQMSS